MTKEGLWKMGDILFFAFYDMLFVAGSPQVEEALDKGSGVIKNRRLVQ